MAYQWPLMSGVATSALPRLRTARPGGRPEVCACTGGSTQAAVRRAGDAG